MKYLLLICCLLFAGFQSFSQNLASKEFRPQIGIGAGYFSYYGEVNNNRANSPLVGQAGFSFDISRKISSYFDLGFTYINGAITGNQNSGNYYNFQTRINSFSAYGLYNWGHLWKNEFIQPYTSIGFETFEFNSKSDMVDASGNTYYYWSDGSIKNLSQTAPNASDAVVLKRDYNYETDLRGLNLDGLGNYSRVSFSVPIGIGVQFNVSERFTVRLGTSYHYTFTDNIDNITKKGKGVRAGNNANDYFFFNSVSIHYDLIGGAARSKKDFRFVDYFEINTDDSDQDGVFNWYDRCVNTPANVKVDSCGCPIDGDKDGIADYLDKEESAPKAYVNDKGVELTDADYEKWYHRYMDSITASYEVLVKLADANRGTNNIYRVLVGEYSKKIPEEHVDKFLAQPDIIAAFVNDSLTAYLVGKYGDLEEAKARQKQLLDAKFPMAKIVIQRDGKFVPLDDPDKAIEQERNEKAKEKLKDKEGQYAIELGTTPASANVEDKAKFVTADKDVKIVEGEKNSSKYIVGKYKDLTSASVDLPTFKKEFKDAKVVKIVDGKVVDDKDTNFYKATVVKEPTALEQLEGKYAVKVTKITANTPETEKQKIEKILPQNVKVDNSDGTKDVLNDKQGYSSPEAAKKEADLLKQKGYKTEIVKVENGKLNPVRPATTTTNPIVTNPVVSNPVEKDPVENRLKDGEYAVKIGRIDEQTPPAVKAKLESTPGAVKVKNEDGSTDVVIGTFSDVNTAIKKQNEQKAKGIKSPEIVKVQDGKLVKATGSKEAEPKDQAPVTEVVDSVKNKELIGNYTVKVGDLDKGVSNKEMDKILNIPDVKGTETYNPNKTTYTAGNYVSLDSAKSRAKQLNNQGFSTEVVKYNGKKFDNVPNTKAAANPIVVKDGKVVFRVQLGAFKNRVSDAAFRGEQVVHFDGQDGLVRYATGSFESYSQAAEHKYKLREKGFTDAFVTAYKDGARVPIGDVVNQEEFQKTQIDSVQKKSVLPKNEVQKEIEQKQVQSNAGAVKDTAALAKLKIYVQVGLFAGEPPAETQIIFATIPDLRIETTEQGLKRYLTGDFKNPADALAYRDSLKAKGITDAFLIAYYNGVKISVATAAQQYERLK